eukprot:Tbor_TRINITY_DN5102_c1_g10::TRINITY_DN5102_c1_g10_i1::g.26350::m.26350
MDFSRVFAGDIPNQQYSNNHHNSIHMHQPTLQSAGDPHMNPQKALKAANDACNDILPLIQQHETTTAKMANLLQMMTKFIDSFKLARNELLSERDRYVAQLSQADSRLKEVQRVVQRYAVVEEPVVASDGFTYERSIIKKYLDDCNQSGMPPTSQQTQTVLTGVLIPNQSLKKLVELLKPARPTSEMPTAIPSAAETASGMGTASLRNKTDITNAGPTGPGVAVSKAGGAPDGELHPCMRVYGFCNYKENCTYAQYPFDACLSHLKGKCRFGSQCHELHVDVKGIRRQK